jgi:hypothetical protein
MSLARSSRFFHSRTVAQGAQLSKEGNREYDTAAKLGASKQAVK